MKRRFIIEKITIYLLIIGLIGFQFQISYVLANDETQKEINTSEIENYGEDADSKELEIDENNELNQRNNKDRNTVDNSDTNNENEENPNNIKEKNDENTNEEIENTGVEEDTLDTTEDQGSEKEPTITTVNTLKSTPTHFKNGDRHPDIIKLKQNLNKLGFSNFKNPTNLFASQTEKSVKDFQRYYKLSVDGMAGPATLAKINEILKSPFQSGKYHNDTIQLKKDLTALGFANFKNPNNFYASQTKAAVEKFQKKHGLPVSGIAEEITRSKIKTEVNKIVDPNNLKSGDRHSKVIQLKKDLNKLGFSNFKNPTNLFASQTEQAVKAFQKHYKLAVDGIAGPTTQSKLTQQVNSPFQSGKRHKDTIQLKKDLTVLGFANFKNPNNFYASQTKAAVEKFQKKHGLPVSGIAEEVTRSKIKTEVSNIVDPNNIKSGQRHARVVTVKKQLNKLGFSSFVNPNNLHGPQTVAAVKKFQKYYGLTANGILNQATQNKLKAQANSPFQSGKRHNDTTQLKKDLTKLGFANFKNPNNFYASQTKAAVEKFQKKHGLPVSGIAEEVTMNLIKEKVKLVSNDKEEYTNYNITLNKALDIQMSQEIIITDKYKNDPAYVSAKYVKLTGEATINASVVNVRTDASTSNKIAFQLNKGTKITIVEEKNGTSVSGSPLWYKIEYNKKTGYVHSSLVSTSSGTVTANVNVRANNNASSHIYGKLTKGSTVTILEQGTSWHKISYNTWRNPKRSDMKAYLDPSKNDKMQHLRLDSSVGVTAAQLNKVLSGKGILAGKGQSFINGTKKYGVNEAYLIAHAQLETGNGTSSLAKGIKYNGKTVYNMYGIGAVDSNPLNGGAKTAYENGWFTPEAAIEGGAEWIAKQYIQNTHKQNTLYKMKWNPNMANGYAWKQYATDIGWAVKQVPQIENIYNQLNNPTYHYDIASYR